MKDEAGFSLLEVVISIAALTLISGFIIQMFIAALCLNRKAYNMDMGSNAAAQALETFKGGHMNAGKGVVTQYFDKNWNEIIVEQTGMNDAAYILTVSAVVESIRENDVYAAFNSNGGYVIGTEQARLYRLDAVVYERKENDEQERIAGLSTRKFLRAG